MPEPLRVEPLDAANLDDFRALLSAPPHGWCWCVAWEVPTWDGWTDRTEEANRSLREELWSKGEYLGYLLYDGVRAAGWCRVGPRRTWPKLCRTFDLDPEEEVHSFTCFGVRGELQGKGLAHTLVEGVLDDLRRRGVRLVEAFPRKIEGRVEPGEVWTGPAPVFERAGFEIVREFEGSWHMQKAL